jgi:uncharacterized protein involved in outer membrane biogenesis
VRKKLMIASGILVILLVIAALAVPRFLDVNRYRSQIEAKLGDQLGRDVLLGPMKLSLIPLAFRVENAVIAEDSNFTTGRPFARVQELFVSPELLPLLRHEIQIKSLQFDHPAVELVKNERGMWNFASLIQDKQAQKRRFSFDQLKIYDGQIGITDQQQHEARTVYDHIDLVVSDFAPEKPSYVDVRAHVPGSGQQLLTWQGNVGPFEREAIARTPFDGKLKLDGVSLAGLQQFMNLQALENSDAILTGNAEVKNSENSMTSTGQFEIREPRIRSVDVGYPIRIDYQFSGNLNQSTFVIQKADVKLGQTPVAFHGSINAQPTPIQVDMTVQASNASIAEAARLAAAFGAVFDAKSNVGGTLNLNVHAQGPITSPSLTGQAAARNVRISGGDVREPVQVDAVELSLSPASIRSNEFTARTGHTSAAAQFTVSGYTSNAPRVEAKINTANAELQELLRIAHAYGISAVQGINGSGLVTLNVTASGPARQTDQLVFSGNGAVRNASLNVPSIAKPLAVRKVDLRFSGNGVSLDDADFSIGQTTAHGNLVVNDFSAPRLKFALSANHINVAEWEQLFQSRPKTTAVASKSSASKSTMQKSFITQATGTGSVIANTIVYDELRLTDVHSTVALDHGIVTMKPVAANLYNGEQAGKIVVNTRTTPTTYTVDSRLQGVDANQLLSSISPVKQTLYGILSANADTHFTTSAGAHSILPSLNGKVSLNLRDGKVANVDLLHQLAGIAQFQRAARAVEPFTQLLQMTGDFDIRNGVARTNNLKAVIDAGSLAATGTVDLARQKLDLHLTAVLSQEYSQTVGGTNIGGFLNTALANNNGELVIPVIVTGTFQEPQFAPDLQKVAQMKLQNLVPNIDDPANLGKGILGQILRGKPDQPAEEPQDKSEEDKRPDQEQPGGLQDLLDLLQKRK